MLVVQGEMLVGQGEMVVIQGEMVVHQDTGRVGESKWSCLITVTPCYQTICVCVCARVARNSKMVKNNMRPWSYSCVWACKLVQTKALK